MKKRIFIMIAAVVAVLLVIYQANRPRSFSVLSLNDVYKIAASDEGRGGFARFKTLYDSLLEEDDALLVLHGGDFLFPSALSERYEGAQMIDVLNALNGDDDAFNSRMFIVPGNHEFDKRSAAGAVIVQQRMLQSEFTWLTGNVRWQDGTHPELFANVENLLASKMVVLDGMKVGILGISIANNETDYAPIDDNYVAAAKAMSAELRAAGAKVVIGLTHINLDDDEKILTELNALGPDIIFGGHEHIRQHSLINGRHILKADSNLESAIITTITVDGDDISVAYTYKDIDNTIAVHDAVKARVTDWHNRFNAEVCGAAAGEVCGLRRHGKTTVTLTAKSDEIRRFETNIGNWMADQMLKAYAADDADIAFFNSGTVRVDSDIAAGSYITDNSIYGLLPYDPSLHLIEITGKELKDILALAASNWKASGHWLQVSGLVYRHDPERESATDIYIQDGDMLRPVRDDETLRAVTVGYILDETGPQDGYVMLGAHSKVASSTGDLNFRAVISDGFKAAGEAGISPMVEGRICTTVRPEKCLIPAP